ncbi:hypothetical protein NOR_00005 [Metarhizium rileyi]|uniref:Uncharacterized protein n=1 Tax=Metarhizium rileyi (strain RCEF 4871) TaxID=1649241 RepID=A0A167K9J0_METRR|nr:hypothetical protein NOR_00005 [Metarhizium rileyi RCEF 4871]
METEGGQGVARIVLSGGLGPSPYVFKRMKESLDFQKQHRPWLQKIVEIGTPTVHERSYGVVVEQPYDPNSYYNCAQTVNP